MEIKYNSEFSIEKNREEFLNKLNEFKHRNNFEKMLGIIGSSDTKDLERVDCLLSDSMKDTFSKVGLYAVVSGGTRGGMPELALKISKRINLPTIGIFPEDGEKYVLKDLLDMYMIIPRPLYGNVVWGSETPVLASIPDVVIVNGGGWGTLVEIGTIMKRNKSLLKQKQKLVPIISVDNTSEITKIFRTDDISFSDYGSVYFTDNSSELTEILVRSLDNKNERNN